MKVIIIFNSGLPHCMSEYRFLGINVEMVS